MDSPQCPSCDGPARRAGELCSNCAADPLELCGTELGGFHVLDVSTRHGHAIWYRAEGPDRPLLVKVLPVSPEVGFPEIKGLIEEIRFLRGHPHPAFPAVYDTGGNNRMIYGVYEWIEGTPLSAQVHEALLPTHEAIPLALRLAEAFLHVDANGLLLRVLPPRWIRTQENGDLRILDASAICAEKGTVLPPPPAREGEDGFRPPEMLSRPRSAARPGDVYLLGALLFYMLVGEFLFQSSQRKHNQSGVLDHIPSGLADILEKALSSEPERRYGSIKEFTAALKKADLKS